jgi:putative heme-binding domain-containing protein
LWRLEPPDFQLPKLTPLATSATSELVAQLENRNAWHRETAHRLLFERQDKTAVVPLRKLLEASSQPLARLHALWSLDGLAALTQSDIHKALADPVGGIREHAVRLAESRFNAHAELANRIAALAADADARVRFQVAFSLGEVPHDTATAALIQIAKRDAADEHIRAAVLSSAARHAAPILAALLADGAFAATDEAHPLLRLLAQSVGAGKSADDLKTVARALVSAPTTGQTRPWKTEVVCGLGEGIKRTGQTLALVFADVEPQVNALAAELLKGAARLAVDPETIVSERVQAAQMLGFGAFAAVQEPLLACLDSRQPLAVQQMAIRTLAAFPDAEVAEKLLAGWPTFSPPVRTEVVEAMLARVERIPLLLDQVEQGKIGVGQLSPVRRGLLMKSADAKIRDRAKVLFAPDAPGPRHEVIREYEQKVALLKGNAQRGQVAFERECATCHRLANKGQEVGPNLETVRHHAPRQVLTNILDPSREVSPNYVEYIVATKDGKISTGMLSSETATSVTLRRANDVQETILRENIEEILGSGKSLMPEGLEQKISPQDMADLLSFLLGPRDAK